MRVLGGSSRSASGLRASEIAPVGHAMAQTPQPMQRSSLTV